jgi:hypothetical protein
MFAWRRLDPKVTAEVILILARRLSLRGDRVPEDSFYERALSHDKRAPRQAVAEAVGEGVPVRLPRAM